MRAAFAPAVLAVLAAGCLAAPEGTPLAPFAAADPFGGFPDPFVMGPEHEHGDLGAHALSTSSMELLARNDFSDAGVPYVASGEVDLLGEDHLVVAGVLDGFYVVDVSDRAAPRTVSFTPHPSFNGDVKASKSGNFVFLGTQLIGFQGVQAWNVAVRERPVLAGAWPVLGVPGETANGGCHMLSVHGDYLYCAPNDATVRIFRVTETPAAIALEPVGMYAPKDAPLPVLAGSDAGGEMTHDMTVQDDPVTGKPVMYVSFWSYGVRVVDVSDPAKPVELGAWTGEGSDAYDGNVHTSMATMLDGKRVIVTIPEYASTPAVTLLDATDYASMSAIGVWAPHSAEEFNDAEEDPSTFSTHNFQVVGGRAYVAMYHGGVWVLDLATMTPLGYYLPSEAPPQSLAELPSIFGGVVPNTWDIVLKDGVIYASDIPTGLYALRFAGDELGDSAATSFG